MAGWQKQKEEEAKEEAGKIGVVKAVRRGVEGRGRKEARRKGKRKG